jgi:hypothetical protein
MIFKNMISCSGYEKIGELGGFRGVFGVQIGLNWGAVISKEG